MVPSQGRPRPLSGSAKRRGYGLLRESAIVERDAVHLAVENADADADVVRHADALDLADGAAALPLLLGRRCWYVPKRLLLRGLDGLRRLHLRHLVPRNVVRCVECAAVKLSLRGDHHFGRLHIGNRQRGLRQRERLLLLRRAKGVANGGTFVHLFVGLHRPRRHISAPRQGVGWGWRHWVDHLFGFGQQRLRRRRRLCRGRRCCDAGRDAADCGRPRRRFRSVNVSSQRRRRRRSGLSQHGGWRILGHLSRVDAPRNRRRRRRRVREGLRRNLRGRGGWGRRRVRPV